MTTHFVGVVLKVLHKLVEILGVEIKTHIQLFMVFSKAYVFTKDFEFQSLSRTHTVQFTARTKILTAFGINKNASLHQSYR